MTTSVTRPAHSIPRSVRQRWQTASELLRLLHVEPGITRREACDRLSLTTGGATELIERLRESHLVSEERSQQSGPGRPTTTLGAHPDGPLAAIVDLRTSAWQLFVADLAGTVTEVAAGEYGRRLPADFLPEVGTHVARAVRARHGRVRAVVAAAAGTVSGTRLLQFATRGWTEADLGLLAARLPSSAGLRFFAGNDATLSGIAEARSGAARGGRVALHLYVVDGVGGALLIDGEPVPSATGAGGEYGHLPFGDPSLRCPCGASGCWDLMVDGRALARQAGHVPPADPVAYCRDVLRRLREGEGVDAATRRGAREISRALGAGVAGLVNLHDPDVVTLGGLAPEIRATEPGPFDEAFRGGLIGFHRPSPPPVLDSVHSQDGPVRGAIGLAVDDLTTPMALERWNRLLALRLNPPRGAVPEILL